MSAYHQIFARPGHLAYVLVDDISAACGARLAPVAGGADYSVSVGHAAVEYERFHEYEDDLGIPFQSYESVITIRDFDRDMERQGLTAARIFQNLAVLGTYSMVLVFDLQRVLDSATARQG
ncbi:hypothetical protein GCM10011583_40860 [Streptomyces camponoticapitis]|uniref:Uncharacterized protein n=1 Tax=Streptomyces camponoticapitis TaxID=1616125 RepID=A0ABQ2EBD7_9ACTN|nr:hypothetical protein [Streptomyces camponoticapitis]GGK04980.1 hypothetical protein GCM10011583_40860 [Streptomyces camponoticapitis]